MDLCFSNSNPIQQFNFKIQSKLKMISMHQKAVTYDRIKKSQTSCNDRSSVSTVVINMYDVPNSWPAHTNKNVRDHLPITDPLLFQCTAVQETKKDRVLLFQSFAFRGNFQMGRVLKDLGLCTLSLLIKFIVFTANVSGRTQPVHYQQMDSTIVYL